MEPNQANQLTDPAQRERCWLCEEFEMKNRALQEDLARNCKVIEELRRICCSEAERARQFCATERDSFHSESAHGSDSGYAGPGTPILAQNLDRVPDVHENVPPYSRQMPRQWHPFDSCGVDGRTSWWCDSAQVLVTWISQRLSSSLIEHPATSTSNWPSASLRLFIETQRESS